uniref:Glycosyl transferase family 1 domain-containing protein n=1 Tax=viral metagenome TaxID=1070528 RepID=A0A6C0E823_9ZZZZ
MKNSKLLYVLITFFCVFLYYIHLNLSYNNRSIETFENNSVTVPTVSFPFKNLFDQNGKKLNIILISAPFRNEEHEKLYIKYKNIPNISFMGISSYSEFPSKLTNPYENRYHEEKKHDYQSMVTTWLHCFRNPDAYLRPNIPRLLLSESDLKDYQTHKPDQTIKKEYDFIYVCLKDNDKCEPGWQSYNRNWTLAKKCLEIMCEKYGLKGCLIGRQNCKFTNKCNGIVKVLPFLKYHEFQKELQKAKFLFVPNISDASPRVIVEAMCYNLRLLVNYNIVGGWKYVTQETGEFFNNEHDVEPAIDKLLKNMDKYTPRDHFINNYGKEKSGKTLATFIKTHYPNVQPKELSYVTITI